MEYIFYTHFKIFCQFECQIQGRVVSSVLYGDDGLSGHAYGFRKLTLCYVLPCTADTKFIVHPIPPVMCIGLRHRLPEAY